MNRNQRRYGRIPPKKVDNDTKFKTVKGKNYNEINDLTRKPPDTKLKNTEEKTLNNENKLTLDGNSPEITEVLPPTRRSQFKSSKHMTNRCCYVSPDRKDFGQFTEVAQDQYQNLLKEQYGFDPVIPETVTRLKELKKMLCSSVKKIENYSQYIDPEDKNFVTAYVETIAESQWQNLEDTTEIDKYILSEKKAKSKRDSIPLVDIRISEVPQIKVIAEKFLKYKKNNIELRKLDEKIVCIEYDIFETKFTNDAEKLIQKMRAYFTIKPSSKANINENATLSEIPSDIKNKFNIADKDLRKLNEKEVEIIDGKIEENRPYLDDLKRVLRRKQAIIAQKNKTSLDLFSLYTMAKRERIPLDEEFSNTDLLSKAELQEVKDLILKTSELNVRGICRRTVKWDKDRKEKKDDSAVISASFVSELLREVDK